MIRKYSLELISFFALALLIAFGLKYHYSYADSDDLIWVLKPTAFLVESIINISFVRETNLGFVNYDHQVIIAPSCAGVNFMIIVFCMSAFLGLSKMKGAGSKNLWIVISLISAYFYTLFVNTIRIIISIHSYETGLFQSFMTSEGVHRVQGIFIYFICLYIYYIVLRKIKGAIREWKLGEKARDIKTINYTKIFTASLTPVFWYCSITLGIPFLNQTDLIKNSEFVRHSAVVLSVCLIVILVIYVLRIICQGLLIKLKYRCDC